MSSASDDDLAAARDAVAAGKPLEAVARGVLSMARTLHRIADDVRDIRRQAMRGK